MFLPETTRQRQQCGQLGQVSCAIYITALLYKVYEGTKRQLPFQILSKAAN